MADKATQQQDYHDQVQHVSGDDGAADLFKAAGDVGTPPDKVSAGVYRRKRVHLSIDLLIYVTCIFYEISRSRLSPNHIAV